MRSPRDMFPIQARRMRPNMIAPLPFGPFRSCCKNSQNAFQVSTPGRRPLSSSHGQKSVRMYFANLRACRIQASVMLERRFPGGQGGTPIAIGMKCLERICCS